MDQNKRRLLVGLIAIGLIVAGVQSALTQTSSKLPSVTSVVPQPAPGIPGEPVAITAIVQAVNSNTVPTGTVEFLNGPDSLGTAALVAGNGVSMASLAVELPPGSYFILAQYNGDDLFALSVSVPSFPFEVLP